MNYLDVFFSRVNHLGTTTAERIHEGGVRSFYKWLAESPHTIKNLSVERGIYFPGIILTSKDKEYQKIMFLNVADDIPIKIGDIMNWQIEDGSIEKWLLFQEEKKSNKTYKTYWIVRCNYLIKWIDENGHLRQSWSYLVSSVDDKIKANFRTWHNLITPQANKYAEILMPRYNIGRSTNFIVEDESWNVIEYDYTSVPGVIYLSTSENKINMIYDDLENDIADLDKKAKYELALPEEVQNFNIGSIVEPAYTLVKNGVPFQAKTMLTSNNTSVVKEIEGVFKAVGAGETTLTLQLVDYPDIKLEIPVTVSETAQEELAYIEGPQTIRLDREATYKLVTTGVLTSEVIYSIDNSLLAQITVKDNLCILSANAKNKLGSFTLTAEYKGKTYTKNISIVPLW